MLDSLTNAWAAIKGGALEAGAKVYLNNKIGNFGSVTKLDLDPRQRTMFIEVQLKGEVSPITINVGSYNVTERNGVKFMTVQNVRASREWIGLAIDQYVAGREFKIPDGVARVL